MKHVLFLLFAAALCAQEKVDLSVVHRIRAEAFEESQISELMFYLADLHAPRVTNSENYRKGAEWAMTRMREYGLENIRKENWGPFGRGWEYSYFSAHMLEPQYQPLIGFPLAYTPSTQGVVTAEVVYAPMATEQDFEKFKGKLKGKIVLYSAIRMPGQLSTPATQEAQRPISRSGRYTEQDLELIALAPDPTGGRGGRPPDFQRAREFQNKLGKFLLDEGALAGITSGRLGDSGTVFGTTGGSHDAKIPLPPPMAVITPEQYNRMARLIEKKVAVKMQMETRAKVFEETLDSFNVLGEIPGTRKASEVVLLGAHFDTWHGATGAADDSTGTAAMLEAMRILKKLGLKMDRTVRVALWSAEEQGLLGSRAYVKQHYADRETMQVKPEHATLAAYFNHDNGSGSVRGIYLQGNDMVRPIFEAWLKPFRDLGAATLSIRNTGGTDHQSFDAVGLPGFQFIQDPLDYNTRTHHSNMDVRENVKESELMQAAAIIASFAYNAATREEMLPRKPLPKPQPEGERRP